ncbi:MAG: hypothetical protein ACTSYL_02065 [Candidatus Thorarchaeota archaeon]
MTSDADENYWLGVRDALRMVDSFIEWARLNPDRAKPLTQFINEALIAAARRCKSCLTHTLGISFAASQEEEKQRISARPTVDFFEDTQTMIESSPLADTLSNPDDLYGTKHQEESSAPPSPEVGETSPSETSTTETTPSFEMTPPPSPSEEPRASSPEIEFIPHHEGPRIETEHPAQFHEVTPSTAEPEEASPLEALERTGEMSEDDISPEGTPRDFGTDFHLAEPEPLSSDEPKHEHEPIHDETAAPPESSTGPEEDVSAGESESSKSDDSEFASEDSFKDAIAEIDRVLDEAFAVHSETEARTSGTDEHSEFTWQDYEGTMTPQESPLESPSETSTITEEDRTEIEHEEDREEPLVTPPPEDTLPSIEEEPSDASGRYTEELTETPPVSSHDETAEERTSWAPSPESHDAWSPYDEPSIEHEPETPPLEEPEEDSDKITSSEETVSTITTPPPPPPPPPEPDESEEERQKRTRRLFFGA